MNKIDKLTELLNIDKLELPEKSKEIVSTTKETLKEIDEKIKDIDEKKLNSPDLLNFKNLIIDYNIIRENLIKLIDLGQKFLSTSTELDIYELKAGQIMAIADVYNSITNSLKTLMDIYKQISDIDLRYKKYHNNIEENNVQTNIENAQIQQIVFSGTSSELLDLIKNAKKEST